jgi:hypothetical protein
VVFGQRRLDLRLPFEQPIERLLGAAGERCGALVRAMIVARLIAPEATASRS